MPHFVLPYSYALVVWLAIQGVSMGQDFTNLKVNPERLQYAGEVEQDALKKGDSLLLAEAWYLYGKTYVFTGDYRTAQRYFLKALRIHESHGNSLQLSRLYVRMSENEARLGRLKQALYYATLSLQVAQHLHADSDKDKALIRSYGALAHIYEAMWGGRSDQQLNYNRVLSYYKKREFLCQKLNDTSGVAEVSLELGELFTKAKDSRAIPYLEKALYLFTLKNKDGIRVNTMINLAAAYLKFSRPEQCIQILNKAEQLYNSKKLNEYEIRLDLENKFVSYYEASGQWEKAFERLRKLNELERIKLLADRDGAITRLNIEYETEKKEALLNAQKKAMNLDSQNLHLQQRLTFIASALLIIAAGMSIVFFRLSRKNQRISRQNEELVKEQNHRVKNNLQVISSLLSLQAKQLTDEVAKKAVAESRLRVESMAIVHRRLYDGDKLAEVNLDEFIRELVQGVLSTYGYDYIQTDFTIDAINLPADQAVPLGLIMNELTTNACKYAFPDNENPMFSVSCLKKKNKLKLKITDNGPGLEGPGLERSDVSGAGWTNTRMDSEQYVMQRESFGMQLIQAQVAQLYGTCQFSSGKGLLFTMEFSI